MKNISTLLAPAAVGPYSQAVCHGEYLFVSGQLGIDPSRASRGRCLASNETVPQ